MKIALASDHAGFEFKEHLKGYLQGAGHQVQDFGPDSDKRCDFPKFAIPVAQSVVKGENERGILVCGTGLGMCEAANKVSGAYAATAYSKSTAASSRAHNDTNVLCLGAREFSFEHLIEFTDIWLVVEFLGKDYDRRNQMIRDMES